MPVIIATVIFIIIMYGSCLLFTKFYTSIRNFFIKVKAYDDLQELNREINVEYSPAVLSYLMNHQIEPKKDVTATLLNLYVRGIVDVRKEGKKYVFSEGENKTGKMSTDEHYVYRNFIKKNRLDIETWEEYVKLEYSKYDFSKKIKNWNIYKFYIILTAIISVILFPFIIKVEEFSKIPLAIWISIIISAFVNVFISVIVETIRKDILDWNMFLNKTGKGEVSKWLKFKKFIQEYTLIEDRSIEETLIFEKYIPYAMALNINKKYKNKYLKVIDIDELTTYIIMTKLGLG